MIVLSSMLLSQSSGTHKILPCASFQVRHIIAGTAARTMAQAFIHPIDTVKTRLQVAICSYLPYDMLMNSKQLRPHATSRCIRICSCSWHCSLQQGSHCVGPAQVNKKTAPELLKAWRTNSKAHPVDLYVNNRRVVHMRNWLVKACTSPSAHHTEVPVHQLAAPMT